MDIRCEIQDAIRQTILNGGKPASLQLGGREYRRLVDVCRSVVNVQEYASLPIQEYAGLPIERVPVDNFLRCERCPPIGIRGDSDTFEDLELRANARRVFKHIVGSFPEDTKFISSKEMRDRIRIRCCCGVYLQFTEERDSILQVQEHACELTKKFDECNHKGTFANCSPAGCRDCCPVEVAG